MTALALIQPSERRLKLSVPWWLGEVMADQTENRRFFITKGLGAGGTYGAAIWHYLLCRINRFSRFSWAIAPTYLQVQDTLIPTFAEVLQNNFGLMEGVHYEVIASGRPRIRLITSGQEIHFKSANRADRFVGPSISHITMTEPGLFQPVAFEKASARLRCPRALRLQQLWEGTPEGMGNRWEEEANFAEGVDEKRNARRLIVPTSHNLHLKPSYKQNLERTYSYDSAKLQSYLQGVFVPFTRGTAFWEFRESRNVVLDVAASQYLPITFSWDFGVSPLAWVAIQHQPYKRKYSEGRRWVVVAEGDGKARGVQDGCAQFIAAFPPAKFRDTPIEIDGGHDGYFGHHLSESCAYDTIHRILSRYYSNVQIVASKGAPLVKDTLDIMAQVCAYEMFAVAAWCQNTRRSMTTTCLKEGTWQLEKPKGTDPTHFGDPCRYTIFRVAKGLDLENLAAKRVFGISKPI